MSIQHVDLALTAAGQRLRAKIEAGYGTIALKITRIVTASGTSDTPLALTDVVNQKQEFTITGRYTEDARTTIKAVLTNAELSKGYTLSQIGFYALDPDEGEILYRISQFETPNYVPASTERGWTYEPSFNFFTGNASDVDVKIDPSGIATLAAIYGAVEVSGNAIPAVGVKTHFFEVKAISDYIPFSPEPEDIPGIEDGLLDTDDAGRVRGYINDGSLHQMAISINE